ncbi:hypothetical protein [Flavobacterium subsaxonicum]|uniref:Repeat protein (TIGR03806 family) n=1 Tax=Flavobacterium subsaxonicum WB 4.1-42 = DSM 21790 TaxID=1121898 RepID=A0A0A2MJZ2_9FLAO|nr:hypothetical protein [Flavobacterium subsaxonicum]KGO92962.1 hypothetical protein Q766_10070 [Flavobacterium subsaxonicum WB 4.1-42 = DSM 21790]
MKKHYPLTLLLVLFFSVFLSCGSDDGTDYTDPNPTPVDTLPTDTVTPAPQSPVVMDLTTVPYAKLSDYNFFEGDLKNLSPVYGVLPYDLNSSLFTDYARKKRFVWIPAGKKATYTTDGTVLDFPTGTALIKTFYYNTVVPDNSTIIIETRVMIRKESGWMFATYVWNEAQTEAVLNTTGFTQRIKFDENGTIKTTDYVVPLTTQCIQCHEVSETATAVGPKPQNLNKLYNYADGTKNQLAKWIEFGYLNTAPSTIISTVDWTDASQPLELRVRSYVDINCAHCHTDNTDCGYTPMNFAFNKSGLTPDNMGICRTPVDFVTGNQQYIVTGQDAEGSLMHFRMNTSIQSEMMPPLGRKLVHQEAVALIEQWINSLAATCP